MLVYWILPYHFEKYKQTAEEVTLGLTSLEWEYLNAGDSLVQLWHLLHHPHVTTNPAYLHFLLEIFDKTENYYFNLLLTGWWLSNKSDQNCLLEVHELNLAYDPCEVAPDDDFHACVRTSEGHKTQTFHKTEPYKHILIIDSNATIKAEKPIVAVIVMGLCFGRISNGFSHN